jgi:hypothetical protein
MSFPELMIKYQSRISVRNNVLVYKNKKSDADSASELWLKSLIKGSSKVLAKLQLEPCADNVYTQKIGTRFNPRYRSAGDYV